MPTDVLKLRPGELCRLLNSTPVGEVVTDAQLRRQRSRAGHCFEINGRINFIRYVAWLVQQRHASKSTPDEPETANRCEAALDAAARAALAIRTDQSKERLTPKQEAGIAALLTEPSYTAAAAKAGVSRTTLYRWLENPKFQAAHRLACRDLVATPLTRIQAGTGDVVTILQDIAHNGKRDRDRLQASLALLDVALRTQADADDLTVGAALMNPGDLARLLANRLRRLDESTAPATAKARLVPPLSRAFLQAFTLDELDKRVEAVETVLANRPTPENQ